jgi:hypothetical protein
VRSASSQAAGMPKDENIKAMQHAATITRPCVRLRRKG